MSSPHPLFYNIAAKGTGSALTLRRTFIKTWESVPEHAEHLFEAYLNTPSTISKTELRAAHPSVHRRRSRRLNAAARYLSAERQRNIK